MPASTSVAAANSPSISISVDSIDSIFSERNMFIPLHPCLAVGVSVPPHDEWNAEPSVRSILTASRPFCGIARSFPGFRLAICEKLLLAFDRDRVVAMGEQAQHEGAAEPAYQGPNRHE